MEAAPAIAPASWAIMYPGTSRHGNLPDTARDRGIDVTAGDVPDRVDRADDDEHERERDHPELRHGKRDLGAGRDHAGRGGRACAHEHEERGAQKLGCEFLGGGRWCCHVVGPRPPERPGLLTSLRRDGILLETRSTSSNGVSRNVKPGPGLRPEGTSDLPGQISAAPPGWPDGRGVRRADDAGHGRAN